ncbi:glutathione S-transferase family protein [Oceanicoccus sp. KOV_DT_Chl]|uniref:glutathione S-transferase family protein n=1 Tax=Oceanicoccus sp. KOV_DT_Chl TaxID=1904639 RepID=UPI000C79D7FA|nr:glutathione S-transferase family protein [Oceanicoccus sp. KOV_DT_Chl]
MAIDKPILHQYRVSPFAAKIRRVMYYKQIAFDTVDYGISGAGKIKKINPRGKAPILEHAGKFIADSTDIVAYLDALDSSKPLTPTDPLLQAQMHILEDWADESLYFYDLTMRCWPHNAGLLADDLLMDDKGLLVKVLRPMIGKIIGKQASAQGIGRKEPAAVCAEVAKHFAAINTVVSAHEFLLGDALSIADISVVSMCTVLERAQEANALMLELPALMAWRERVDLLTLPAGTAADQKALV